MLTAFVLLWGIFAVLIFAFGWWAVGGIAAVLAVMWLGSVSHSRSHSV